MLTYARRTVAGSGDVVPHTAQSDGSQNVYQTGLLAGELQQFGRMAGGAIVNYTSIGADTAIKATPGILYGIVCIANGTMASVYDNASAASGTVLIPSQALTAGQSFTFGGMGVTTVNGIFADWTSGTWLVLWV